eukprot:3940846-Rhodomonas_salina.1
MRCNQEDRRRVVANGWDVSDPETLEKWRAQRFCRYQEPFNAHSHMLAMMWGASECIPVRIPISAFARTAPPYDDLLV